MASDYRVVRHPDLRRDILSIGGHVADMSGNEAAGLRRIEEIEAMIGAIADNPHSGFRLEGALSGFLRRVGGCDRRLVVFRPDDRTRTVFVHYAAFGGENWMARAGKRAPLE